MILRPRSLTRRSFVAGSAAASAALAMHNGARARDRILSTRQGTFQNVELTAWVHQGTDEERQTNESIINAFNEAYDGQIRVTPEFVPNDRNDYQNRVTSAAVADELPDILDVDGPFVASYAYGKIFRPINDFFDEEYLSDFIPSIIDQGTWNDQLWALGAFGSSIGVMVNQDLIDEAGITVPQTVDEAWDWTRFAEVARELTTDDVFGADFHMDYGAGEWFTYGFSPMIWSNGGALLSPEATKATGYMNADPAIEAMSAFQQLFMDQLASDSPAETLFEDGGAAMQWIGPWVIAGFPEELNWTVMPLPYHQEQVSPAGSWAWGITQKASNPEAAAEFVRWFLDPETGIVPIVNANRLPPSRSSAYELIDFYDELPYSVYGEQSQKTARVRPVTPGYPVVTARFAEAVADISLGADVEETLSNAAQEIDDDFQRNDGYQAR